MTEIAQYQQRSEIAEQMEYARAVSTGALLPQAYRGKPADILIAVGLGQAMGLSYAESLYRIDVIQGKPTAAAELIAANVRKAGHKLRVKGDETTCTATIIRADDPDFPFTVTRDLAWAQSMGLHTKDNYKKQPGTMLQWRAISAVARLACPEALYGVVYTPDEVQDIPSAPQAPRVTAADFTKPAEVTPAPQPEPDHSQGLETVTTTATAMTPRTRGQLFALFTELGISEDEQRAGIAHVLGRPIESRGAITDDEARRVIERLKVRKAEVEAGAQPVEPGVFKGEQ